DSVTLQRACLEPRRSSLLALIRVLVTNDQADSLAALTAGARDCDAQLEYAILHGGQHQQRRRALALGNFFFPNDLPAERLPFNATRMQGLIGAAAHEDRPWQHAIAGVAGRKRIEDSSKNLRLDGAYI